MLFSNFLYGFTAAVAEWSHNELKSSCYLKIIQVQSAEQPNTNNEKRLFSIQQGHQHWIPLQNTSSYLAWRDSMRQTIVCRHIIQAELIVGEQRVSPPRQPREQRRVWSNSMRREFTAARWNQPLVADGDLLPAFWPRGARLGMLSRNVIRKMLMFWRTNLRAGSVPRSDLRGCRWRYETDYKNDIFQNKLH